jgi:hypothetical protein
MTTKKAILLNKYIEMTEEFKEHFDLFPPPEDIDIVDFLFLVSHYFSPHYKTQDYTEPLLACTAQLGVKVSKQELVFNSELIAKYINFFIEFIKEQE